MVQVVTKYVNSSNGACKACACVQCRGWHVVRNGKPRGLQRYKCRDWGKTLNALAGTPLARLRYGSAEQSTHPVVIAFRAPFGSVLRHSFETSGAFGAFCDFCAWFFEPFAYQDAPMP